MPRNEMSTPERWVFSWIVSSDNGASDSVRVALMNSVDMPKHLPGDAQRMIFGGFTVLVPS